MAYLKASKKRFETFFVLNPNMETSFRGIGMKSRIFYEFGSLPVRVEDADDAEHFRNERYMGMYRLIETDIRGTPRVSLHLDKPDIVSAPLTVARYKADPTPVPPPQAKRNKKRAPSEASQEPKDLPAFTRVSGSLPTGVAPVKLDKTEEKVTAASTPWATRGAESDNEEEDEDKEDQTPRVVTRRARRPVPAVATTVEAGG